MAEFILSAFADEAGGGLLSQIRALKENNLSHIEPRGLDYGNISDYTEADCREMKMILDYNGIGVSALGSPFGKINIEDDFAPHFEKFKRGVENACILGTNNIRMFSFYFTQEQNPDDYRDEVFARLEQFCDYSLKSGIWCCHENEKGIYGDNEIRCLDILKTLNGKIKGVFDPANFVQCGVQILPAYELLKDYIEYMHIKDCRYEDGFVVPPGKGDACLQQLLALFSQQEGNRFLTLEPHLKVFDGLKDLEPDGGEASVSERFTYPTNRDAFNAAADALHGLLQCIGK
ncbi:MAG: sugar phosphate isomerase/epimerase [Clostridia bacterium]|nr:sugar phosphate isomerase/epimerase [Clostridia bacterium]